jgi:hypothetical protein
VRVNVDGHTEIPVATAMMQRDAELDMLYKAWRDDVKLDSHVV